MAVVVATTDSSLRVTGHRLDRVNLVPEARAVQYIRHMSYIADSRARAGGPKVSIVLAVWAPAQTAAFPKLDSRLLSFVPQDRQTRRPSEDLVASGRSGRLGPE
jgi:hypothetical protein